MSKKSKTIFVCSQCGHESPKWMGQCICGAWNSFVEEKILGDKGDDRRSRTESGVKIKNKPLKLNEITEESCNRLDTGIGELNRVLGGGIVVGSLTLISGEPGIGKSTIIIQTAANIAENYGTVLYVSGEESCRQIKLRGDRVCKNNQDKLLVVSETNMDNIAEMAEEIKPKLLIIDSIQTMYTPSLDSAPGSVSQVRACGNELMRLGKVNNIPVFIVAHVTKSGDLAGPKIVEHLVDCVLSFTGERNHDLRILRAYKNRFGTTSEIGAFEMAEQGLVEIENLSKTFLDDSASATEGSITSAVYEGTRPLLIEIQALVAAGNIGFARRTALGIENSRLSMIIAVLEKKAGINLLSQDVYVNVVGGLKPEGTSTDLAVALAIYSSYRGVSADKGTLALGEIGLTGELRPVQNADKIVKEAVRMGYHNIILPARSAEKLTGINEQVNLLPVKNLREAISKAF